MTNTTEPGTQIAHVATSAPPARKSETRLQADGSGVMAIIPRDLNEAMKYANGLAHSGIVPDSFRYDGKKGNEVNVSLVAMGVLKTLEIGLPPQTGLAFLLPINGRFTVWGDGAWALVQRGGHLDSHTVEWFFPEGFDKHTTPLDKWPNEIGCVVRMWRRGQRDPYENEYTVGRARRAGMWNNSYKKPWQTDPERMLFNRARAYCMRDGFADDLFGLGIAEEVQDYAAPPKAASIDNSALDDEPAMLPPPSSDNMGDQAEAYIAGLAAVPTLAALLEYQSLPNNQALVAEVQKRDEQTYNRVIAANAKRYSEIEVGERRAEEEAADAERRAEQGDLLGEEG